MPRAELRLKVAGLPDGDVHLLPAGADVEPQQGGALQVGDGDWGEAEGGAVEGEGKGEGGGGDGEVDVVDA